MYLERHCPWIESDGQGITREAMDFIVDDIPNCDFPDTTPLPHAMAAKAGFSRCIDVNRLQWHQTRLLGKSESPVIGLGRRKIRIRDGGS